MSSNGVKSRHIGHQIVEMMDRLGVSPIPRNYNLFYACIALADEKLRKAVRELGSAPSQAELDGVIEEYLPEAFGSEFLRRQQDEMMRSIDGILALLNIEERELTSYTGAIGKVSTSLTQHLTSNTLAPEAIHKVASALVDMSRRKSAAGQKTLSGVGKQKDEMGKLKDEIELLRVRANTDDLTNVANRRAFDEFLAQKFSQEADFGLIMLDIDHFKKINDTYGHAGGDAVLRAVAATMKKNLGSDAFLARTGGEEFGIIVSGRRGEPLTSESIYAVAERVRLAIEGIQPNNRAAGNPLKITASFGASMSNYAETVESLYEQTDALLYRSKNGGRNMTSINSGPVPDSTQRFKMYGG